MTVVSAPGQGSVFRVRLFLPEVHGSSKPVAATPKRQPRAYAGPRRKLLVVDNEEPDRELMVQLLQPMGFELRLAASGHDCLDLLAAGYRPDAIFMDLAMPGIDGWETIRRLRVDGHTDIALAVVSANAFDKGLQNDLGVRTEDFIVKPYRHTELFDWLERRLQLTWLHELPAPSAVDLPPAPHVLADVIPDAQQRAALLDVVNLGFYRGIMNTLDEIEKHSPQACKFVEDMRALARQFQFEAMAQQLKSDTQTNA
jgi:CheY-like chemotaxis protein